MSDFEEQLRQLKPAPPSNELMVRLQMARPVRQPQPVSWWWRLALPVAAAAGLVVLVAKLHPAPAVVPPVAQYVPVEVRDYILGATLLGVGHTDGGVPYRLLRSVGLRREVWKKTADGSEVAVVVPQQQLILAKMDVY